MWLFRKSQEKMKPEGMRETDHELLLSENGELALQQGEDTGHKPEEGIRRCDALRVVRTAFIMPAHN